jgi:NAD(P)-dependent dehydrogenase (short-subunit alcohol dehydrogenase family)
MTPLSERHFVVTGAAQGLDRAFAQALVDGGARVMLCDVQDNVLETAREVGGKGIVADVSRRAEIERLVAATSDAFGCIDGLINNAARWQRTPVTDAFDRATTDFDALMDTNLRGLVYLTRACVPHLLAAGGGDIVNVSTYYVLPARSRGTNPPDTDIYNASKWALNGLTQAWALALAKHGIRVNALCMGTVDTPMLRGLWRGDPPLDAVRHWLRPETIAAQLIELLNEGRQGRTGQNIGAWAGEPAVLPPPYPDHRAVTG